MSTLERFGSPEQRRAVKEGLGSKLFNLYIAQHTNKARHFRVFLLSYWPLMIMEDHNRSDDDEEKRCKTDADPDLTGSDDPLSEDEDIDSMIDDYYDSDAFDFDDPPPKSVRDEDHDDLEYRCLPLPEAGNRYLQKGNKIIMPEASLHRLLCSLEVRSDLSMPMLFRVENRSNGKTSNCGVLEFTGSNPKQVFFPNWMMLNMGLNEGDPVTLQSIVLDKATFIKLQPHTTEF